MQAAGGHQMEFLYVNASEGTASGGHAALRFDKEVFHFQHVPLGALRITRDDFQWFRTLYGLAENRTIFGHRIRVSDDTWTLLRDGFNRRLLIEEEQFGLLETLDSDIRLLRLHLQNVDDPYSPTLVEMKAAGLFQAAAAGEREAPLLVHLRASIEGGNGPGFLSRLAEGLRRDIARLQAADQLFDAADIREDRFAPAPYGYAERTLDGLSALAALRVLQGGYRLDPDVLLRPHGASFALGQDQLDRLQAYASRLQQSLAGLPARRLPGWGYALLVGMARLAAIDVSLNSRRLAVLDLGDGAPPPASGGTAPLDEKALHAIAADHERAMAELASAQSLDERLYGRLERGVNLLHHATRHRSSSAPFPLPHPLPARPGLVPIVRPSMTKAQLAGQLARLEVAQQDLKEKLRALYPYDLIAGNCVSELFRTVDHVLVGGAVTSAELQRQSEAQSRRRLGGHVSRAFPNDIPAVAFQAVADKWRVEETRELPSWRHLRLAQARRDSGILAELRESNVLTSRLYRWHPGDAAFLFFSERQPWLGPLTGPLNAAAGLGQGLAGLATLPWDDGHHLRQGAKGFLISLPEILLFNIRKGSYPEFAPAGGMSVFSSD